MKLLQISKTFKQMDNHEMFVIKMFEWTFLKLLIQKIRLQLYAYLK